MLGKLLEHVGSAGKSWKTMQVKLQWIIKKEETHHEKICGSHGDDTAGMAGSGCSYDVEKIQIDYMTMIDLSHPYPIPIIVYHNFRISYNYSGSIIDYSEITIHIPFSRNTQVFGPSYDPFWTDPKARQNREIRCARQFSASSVEWSLKCSIICMVYLHGPTKLGDFEGKCW